MSRAVKTILLIGLFYYLLKDFNLDKIDFANFSFTGIFFTTVFLSLSQVLLGIRWQWITKLPFAPSFETIIVSSILNMALPARLGEVSKAYYLKKFYGYSYHKSISAIFVERFFDVIMLFMIVCVWAYLFFINIYIKNSILVLSAIILATIIFFKTKRVEFFIKKIPFKFIRVYGLKTYKNIKTMLNSPIKALFSTFIIWILYLLSYISFFRYGVNFNLNISDILELFIFSTVALSIPLAPAGVGTFEGSIVLFLSSLNIDKSDALLAATLYHFLIFFVDFVFFYLFLMIKDIKYKDFILIIKGVKK